MSNPIDVDQTPITSVGQLADYLAAGGKPKAEWRIGTEHEKFGFRHSDYTPPGYEPRGDSAGSIRGMLDGLAGPEWEPILDNGVAIGLKGIGQRRGASISLEPGGQFELSGAPLETLHETWAELDEHCVTVSALAGGMGLGFAPLGFHPLASRAEMPWMPKSRYAIMRRYMPLVGSLGLDMMLRTCTVQVNLDYESEADMRRKLRVALALQPLATAFFANSPFTEGQPNGFLSARANVWTDVDADRSGMPALMFAEDFGFERFVAWLLDVPMYFVMRGGRYVDMAGCSFRDFMAGRLADRAGQEPATIGDFADHVTTVFTDVRLKRFLEMRGADAGSPAMMVAQSAFWVGLLYDDAALTAAESLVSKNTWDDYVALRNVVPRLAMNAPWQSGSLRDLGREVLMIAEDGLRARSRRHGVNDETIYLEPLQEIAAGGLTQAENWLAKRNGPWNGNVRLLLDEAQI